VYETNGNKGGEAIVQQGWSATIPDREVLLQGKRLQRRQPLRIKWSIKNRVPKKR